MPQFLAPQESEYPEYMKYYISLVKDESNIIEKLQLQAKEVLSLVEGVSEPLLETSYTEGKWTIAQLMIHLIDTERIFCTRALCIARGEKKSLPGYEQDDYVLNAYGYERSKESLLEEYIANRISTIAFFKGISNKTHGAMGEANGLAISVRSLLFAIAGHEVHHINVLKEKYLN